MNGDQEWEQLKARAARLVHPDAQYAVTDYDFTSDQNIATIAEAIATIPSAWLDAIEQDGTRIWPVRHGQSLAEVSRTARRDAVNLPSDYFAGIEGIHIREERTVYAIDHSPDLIVHELGHAVDWILGSPGDESRPATPNTHDDPLLRFVHAKQIEQLNEYSKTHVRESFAEYFRASLTDTRSPGLDPDDVTPRENAKQVGPTVVDYLDRLQIAVELLLEKDPRAFDRESNVDIRLEVVERALVSAMQRIPVEEIFVDELRERRQEHQLRLENVSKTIEADDRGEESRTVAPEAPAPSDVFQVDGHVGALIMGRLGSEKTLLDTDLFPSDVKAGESYKLSTAENGDVVLSRMTRDVADDLALER